MSYDALRNGRHSEAGRDYLVTAVVDQRAEVFRDLYAARRFIREIRALQEQGAVRWLAWVVMPDHFHGLVTLSEGHALCGVMRLLKGRSSRSVNALLGRPGRLWQPGFHDHALRQEEDRSRVAEYLLANPLRRGLATEIGSYPHWDSALV